MAPFSTCTAQIKAGQSVGAISRKCTTQETNADWDSVPSIPFIDYVRTRLIVK